MFTFREYSQDLTNQATVDATGAASVTFGPQAAGVVWEVQQVTLETLDNSASNAILVKNNSFTICASPLFVNTAGAGVSATATGPPYVYLQAQDILTALINGAMPGDQLTVSWIYRVGVTY